MVKKGGTHELKLDLGCGKAVSPDGFTKVDRVKWVAGTQVTDLTKRWPWKKSSVDEVVSRNLVNYIPKSSRPHFFNELCRVLKPGSKAVIVVPHWCSNQAYADPSAHEPLGEAFFFLLSKTWREEHAYWAQGFTCDFDFTCGYGMHQALHARNQEYQQHAITFWKESAQELIVTLTKR
jgi:SAM-dependent methyltransferase